MTAYPIDSILPILKNAILEHPAVILHAPPGAGKTTRVPLALLDIIPPTQGRIVVLEPRRLAAVSAARWMANLLGEQPGETVGYAIRFDTKRSEKTRIDVVTEGILTRRLQADPGLSGTAVVVFDEYHERSIHADLGLALCLDVRKGLRPDLKIMIMSATLDYGPIADLLGNARLITSAGTAYPVEERYLIEEKTLPLPIRVANAVKMALQDTEGDILVFLPGSGEIRACVKELHKRLDPDGNRIAIHPLYGDLPFAEQEQAIIPSKDKRKLVLATNIAETSLTIDGVRVVIDSGLTRMLRYDPATGMNRLVTSSVSQASAEQRKGRAGRLGPGVCYRMYSRQDYRGMVPYPKPEILSSDLSPLVLELAVWGVRNPQDFAWLDCPPDAAWASGVRLLQDLSALDSSGSVTTTGRKMSRLPLHPRLSRLLTKAQELGCVQLGAEIAAILSERDMLRQRTKESNHEKPDVAARVETLRKWLRGKGTDEALDPSALRTVARTYDQLLSVIMKESIAVSDDTVDQRMIARLLLCAFPDRICKRRGEGRGRFVLVQGKGMHFSTGTFLNECPYLIAVNADVGDKSEGVIYIAAPVTEDLIRSECTSRIRTGRSVAWDKKEARITAVIEDRLDALVLAQRSITATDEEAVPILCDVIRSNPGALMLGHEMRQFQARVMLMRRVFFEETWPDLSNALLFSKPDDWLLPWLGGVRSALDLKGINVLAALKAKLSWEQARLLDERAPVTITVPSGSHVTIDYAAGEQPVLAVKLQEMFGLADTPVIAGNRVKVLLHLLSPARRPVQITQDLRGFWHTAYEQVKKDLKGRYPKHPWPEDPWNAIPTRRTKSRG